MEKRVENESKNFVTLIKIKLIMDISVEIKMIQKELESIHDKHLINSIKSILAFAKSKKNVSSLQPFSIEEYRNRAEISEEDLNMKRYVNINDL